MCIDLHILENETHFPGFFWILSVAAVRDSSFQWPWLPFDRILLEILWDSLASGGGAKVLWTFFQEFPSWESYDYPKNPLIASIIPKKLETIRRKASSCIIHQESKESNKIQTSTTEKKGQEEEEEEEEDKVEEDE